MKPTRQRILEILQHQTAATATNLAKSLSQTIPNIRHHLAILETEGWIKSLGQRPGKGRGRPSTLYGLQEAHHPHNLLELSNALLHAALEGRTTRQQTDFLRHLAIQLGGAIHPTGGNLSQRLYYAIRQLNELRYRARWEAHTDAPRVILAYCPYFTLLEEHPMLCQMDAYLLEHLLGQKVEQVTRLKGRNPEAAQCVFRVG
ncbi:MAG: ArsR family transcriptional regulator [Chloroflexota bacterium]